MFNHLGTAIHSLVINEEIWQSLPADIQQAMLEAGQEAMYLLSDWYDTDTENINTAFEQAGGTILDIESMEEEREQWEKVYEEFTESWLKEHESTGLPYEDVIKDYKNLL